MAAAELTTTPTELRTTRLPVEVRAQQSRVIGGYAATFGGYSEDLGGYVERVMPSFFNKSQADGWPGAVCRFNHQNEYLLGATRSGTLRLSVDATGLDYNVDLPECRSDVLEMVRRGDLGHSSFSFLCFQDDWGISPDGQPMRSLVSGKLIDVAPVPVPAYRGTSVAMRSLARHMSAPLEDVVALARNDDLKKLFVRADRQPLSVAQARSALIRKRYPHTGMDPRHALAKLREKQWPEHMLTGG